MVLITYRINSTIKAHQYHAMQSPFLFFRFKFFIFDFDNFKAVRNEIDVNLRFGVYPVMYPDALRPFDLLPVNGNGPGFSVLCVATNLV